MVEWYIIHLETNDDLGSTCEKITRSRSTKILLVLPREKGILEKRLDLALLSRQARHMGLQLALVTRSAEIIKNAYKSGIPVFSTIEKARKGRLRISTKKNIRLPDKRPDHKQLVQYFSDDRSLSLGHHEVWRIPAFLAGLISVLSLCLLFLPQAQISLKQRIQKHEVQIPLRAIPDISPASMFGELPVKMDTISVRGEGKSRATGNILFPIKKAAGVLEVHNLSDRTILMPVGTIVRTQGDSPVRFITLHPIQVQTNLTNPEIVRIEALEPGSSGNVQENSIQTIEGGTGIYLSIINSTATKGGEDINETAPSPEDIKKLQDEITSQLMEKAFENFRLQQSDRVYLEDSIKVKEVSDIVINPEEGIPSDNLEIELTAAVEIWYYMQTDLERIVQTALQASLPGGLLPINETLSVINVGNKEILENGFQWQVNASVLAYPGWEMEKILPLILGKKITQAEQVLMDQLDLQEAPSITVWPKFWERIPMLPFRIKINNDQITSS